MVKKPTSVAAAEPVTDEPSEYDPAAQYDVTLVKPIVRNGFTYLPRNQHEMSGAFLDILTAEGHGDAIGSATKRA